MRINIHFSFQRDFSRRKRNHADLIKENKNAAKMLQDGAQLLGIAILVIEKQQNAVYSAFTVSTDSIMKTEQNFVRIICVVIIECLFAT